MTQDESNYIAVTIMKMKKRDTWYKRWRNLSLFLIVMMVAMWMSTRRTPQDVDLAHIVMLNIDEAIGQSATFWEQFERIDKKNAKAALILMNSPGGTVGDSERLYYEIEHLRKRMPVSILVENQATSGAYLAALASDRIYAYKSALIGSIGVVFEHFIIKNLLDQWGIEKEQMTTGAYKGYPSATEPTPPHVVENMQRMMQTDHRWFLDLVISRRQLDESIVDKIGGAQIYSAMDALEMGLIDGFSTRFEQIDKLRAEVGDLPVKDVQLDEENTLLNALFKPRRMARFVIGFTQSLLAQL